MVGCVVGLKRRDKPLKESDLNKQARNFICLNKYIELLYYIFLLLDCGFIYLPTMVLERQLLMETMAYVYNTN